MRRRIVLLAILLGLTSAEARADWHLYPRGEVVPLGGLPTGICEDSQGRIFLVGPDTREGYSLVNGNWRAYRFPWSETPFRGYQLVRDSRDSLWIYYDAFLKPLERIPGRGDFAFSDLVSAVVPDGADGFWVAAGESLFHATSSAPVVRIPMPEPGLQALRLALDRTGTLWARALLRNCPTRFNCTWTPTPGIWRYRAGTWTRLSTPDGLLDETVLDVAARSDGDIQLLHPGGRLTLIDDSGAHGILPPVPIATAHELLADRHGGAWIVASDTLWHYRAGTWEHITQSQGYPGYVELHYVDEGDQLWVATGLVEVSRFDGAYWQTVTIPSRPPGNLGNPRPDEATGFYEDRLHGTWRHSGADSISRFDGVRWHRYGPAEGLPSDGPLFDDSAGRLWIGCRGGPRIYENDAWVQVASGPGSPTGSIGRIAEAPDHRLWFAERDSNALRVYDGTAWQRLAVPIDTGTCISYSLLADSHGRIWIGTSLGAAMYDGQAWTVYDSTEGAPQGGFIVLHETPDGRVMGIASRTQALYHFEQGQWRADEFARGFEIAAAAQLLNDVDGRVWMFILPDGVHPSRIALWDKDHWSPLPAEEVAGPNAVLIAMSLDEQGQVQVRGTRSDGYVTLSRWDAGTHLWRKQVSAPPGAMLEYNDPSFQQRNGLLWVEGSTNRICRPDLTAPNTEFLTAPPAVIGTRQARAVAVLTNDGPNAEYAFRIDGSPPLEGLTWSPDPFWESPVLADGPHVLEARSRDGYGNVDPTPAVVPFEVDATPPSPSFATSELGPVVTGSFAVIGTADDARFARAYVQVGPSGTTDWNQPGLAVDSLTAGVIDDTLAVIDSRTRPDGDYDMRLLVEDNLGLGGVALTSVRFDNAFPPAAQTVPNARISAANGGEAYTNDARVHVSFPPHAFADDAEADIVRVPASEFPTVARAAFAPTSPVYALRWEPARLAKIAVLDVAADSLADGVDPDSVGLAFWTSDSPPTILGGAYDRDTKRFRAPVESAGNFTLVRTSGGPGPGPGTTSGLQLAGVTPRVVHAGSGGGGAAANITFSLGAPTSVTARLYNRAGRLVRVLAENRSFPAGMQILPWDARDDDGALAPDGIYVIRLESPGSNVTGTVAVVR